MLLALLALNAPHAVLLRTPVLLPGVTPREAARFPAIILIEGDRGSSRRGGGHGGGGSGGRGGGRGGGSDGGGRDDNEDGQSSDGQPRWPLAVITLLSVLGILPWTRRGLRFWTGASPIIFSYGLLLARLRLESPSAEERGSRLLAQHEKMAPRALNQVQRLAGGYIKMGQVLSNRADLLPEAYIRAFGTLQDDVPPRAWSRMRRSLARDAPALVEQLDSVDPNPLGAASTGQAHLATLRDGTRVVLKLQYADARAMFGADLGNVARLTN